MSKHNILLQKKKKLRNLANSKIKKLFLVTENIYDGIYFTEYFIKRNPRTVTFSTRLQFLHLAICILISCEQLKNIKTHGCKFVIPFTDVC